ncbi:MAG TPA: sugar phosphate isomerase/epimerase [Planctomycetes bacterium]|nr:sugar phosphate isomerase/epimerase [Planctomycetota bacterium]
MSRQPDFPSAPLDRRQLLGHIGRLAAAGWATAPLTALGAHGDSERWTLRLSCSSINFMSLPIEGACQRIAELGFEAVDIWSAHAGCPHLDDVLVRLGPGGLEELLSKHNLKLYAFSVYRGGYGKYAELLGKAGGGVAVRGSARPCGPRELTSRMKAFLEELKPDLELAEKYDSYLAIENHGKALLDSLDSMKAFVDLNSHPRLGIALAPYHVQGRKESVEEAIAVCGKQLLFFYAWQRARGIGQLPGFGPTDCTPWIAALAKADYAWYVNPFMHHEPEPDAMSRALRRSVEYLKECSSKVLRPQPATRARL